MAGINYGRSFKTQRCWAFKQGVFQTPQGKWIARVKNKEGRGGYKTLSQHNTEQEATNIYNEYNKIHDGIRKATFCTGR